MWRDGRGETGAFHALVARYSPGRWRVILHFARLQADGRQGCHRHRAPAFHHRLLKPLIVPEGRPVVVEVIDEHLLARGGVHAQLWMRHPGGFFGDRLAAEWRFDGFRWITRPT